MTLPLSSYGGSNAPTAFVAATTALGHPQLQLAYGARQLRDDYALVLAAMFSSRNRSDSNFDIAIEVWNLVDALLQERERRNPPMPESEDEPGPGNGRLRLTP